MIVGIELLRDITTAELEYECKLKHPFVVSMIQIVSKRYRAGLNFENILDAVVNNKTNRENERHAYKYVLGRLFERRKHSQSIVLSEGR